MGAQTAVTAPRRIQRKRAAGWRLPEGAVCVTRPGKWGNPFQKDEPIARDGNLWPYAAGLFPPGSTAGFTSIRLLTQADVVTAHGWWFIEQPALMLAVEEELGGKDLACWCRRGAPCHADMLLAAANGWDEIPGGS